MIKRHQASGDKTSRISEVTSPIPYPQENQKVLFMLHKLYLIFYGWQDWIIDTMFKGNQITNSRSRPIPNWIMSLISIFGLGFQLLIIAILLCTNSLELTFPIFLIAYNIIAALVVFSVLILVSGSFMFFTRRTLISRGEQVHSLLGDQLKTINHSLGSIRETKILNRENYLTNLFTRQVNEIEKHSFFLYF